MSGPFAALRRRLDVVPAEHRPRPVATGAVVIALAGLAIVSAANRDVPFIGGDPGRELRLEFSAATQVSHRTVVRVGGVDVGRVARVEAGADPSRTSVVVARIADDALELRRDASAQIRWRTVFGGLTYIDLDPGSPSAPPLGEHAIPARRTSTQVELDDFLQPYDGGTAQAQRDVLEGLSDTFADPAGPGGAIEALSPTLTTVRRGLEPARGRRADDLRRLVAATAATVRGLGDGPDLERLVGGADRTLAVTDARREELGQLLELSPPALDSTLATMRRLRTTLDHLDPLVTALRPGARAVAPAARAARPALRETELLVRQARPLLTAAQPTFAALRGASTAGVPLMEGLDPTLRRLDDELVPFLRRRDDETRLRNFESIGPFFSALSMAAGEFDAEGYRIRLTVPTASNSFTGEPPE